MLCTMKLLECFDSTWSSIIQKRYDDDDVDVDVFPPSPPFPLPLLTCSWVLLACAVPGHQICKACGEALVAQANLRIDMEGDGPGDEAVLELLEQSRLCFERSNDSGAMQSYQSKAAMIR